jgi:D-sedoheptulose 7-phosphate isomerase
VIGNVSEHLDEIQAATAMLRAEEIEGGATLLADALDRGRGVYICGNGGSASTASHLAVDLGKNLCTGPGPRMRVVSLTDNVPWLTAVANDQGYENCFAEQLRNYLEPGDLVIGISASGDSENVVRAFHVACDVGADRLALIGFDGGRLGPLATKRVWVDSHDYGVVESLHLIVTHVWVRMLSADPWRAQSLPNRRDLAQGRMEVRKSCDAQKVRLATGRTRRVLGAVEPRR